MKRLVIAGLFFIVLSLDAYAATVALSPSRACKLLGCIWTGEKCLCASMEEVCRNLGCEWRNNKCTCPGPQHTCQAIGAYWDETNRRCWFPQEVGSWCNKLSFNGEPCQWEENGRCNCP